MNKKTDMNYTEYKRLGDYIRTVDVRNKDGAVTKLLGVSISKEFISSIANTIGTDMSTYKIVKRNQFAYGPVTSRNGEKVSIALLTNEDQVIISQAYTVFEIKNVSELLPEYLMMWFRRPEFDRYARFHSHGSAREIFDWSEMCEMELPIPEIDRQREIVAEYETLSHRIRQNEQMISKLEETAQTIYRQMFVDDIDKENLPKGWRSATLANFGKIITGKTPSTLEDGNFGDYMPFVTIPDMHAGCFVLQTDRMLSKKGVNSQLKRTIPANSVCISCIGTSGLVAITTRECQTNQQINTIVPKNPYVLYYLYMVCCDLRKMISEFGIGGAVLNNLNKSDFENLPAIMPADDRLIVYDELIRPIYQLILIKQQENKNLNELQSLLTMKIGYYK